MKIISNSPLCLLSDPQSVDFEENLCLFANRLHTLSRHGNTCGPSLRTVKGLHSYMICLSLPS